MESMNDYVGIEALEKRLVNNYRYSTGWPVKYGTLVMVIKCYPERFSDVRLYDGYFKGERGWILTDRLMSEDEWDHQ